MVLDTPYTGYAILLPCVLLGNTSVKMEYQEIQSTALHWMTRKDILSLSAERMLWISKAMRLGKTCMLPRSAWGSDLLYNQMTLLHKQGYSKLEEARPEYYTTKVREKHQAHYGFEMTSF